MKVKRKKDVTIERETSILAKVIKTENTKIANIKIANTKIVTTTVKTGEIIETEGATTTRNTPKKEVKLRRKSRFRILRRMLRKSLRRRKIKIIFRK